ncbi:DUF6508 domain-containing protein [Falsihalocynthiibacter sp. BN13B15]|uniref:DUF6508 domain-containing protein n=1 Tax=Falsihalocynthiibacter sp. BN13B15 TaxID=3240871 RepID=UPI00350E9292
MVGDPSNQEQLLALASFLPVLEAAEFSAGEMVSSPDTVDGVSRFPHGNPREAVGHFLDMLYEQNWVVPFDWQLWMETQGGVNLFAEDGVALASASPEQLCKMLTTFVRRDRFSWGDPLMGDFESGLITRIVRRAHVLSQSSIEDA